MGEEHDATEELAVEALKLGKPGAADRGESIARQRQAPDPLRRHISKGCDLLLAASQVVSHWQRHEVAKRA